MRLNIKCDLKLIWKWKLKTARTRSPDAVCPPQVCPILVFLSYVGLLQTIFSLCISLHLMTAVLWIQAKSSSITVWCRSDQGWVQKKVTLRCHLHCLLLFNHPVSYPQQGKWRRGFHLVCEWILGSPAWRSPHLRVHIVDVRCLSPSSPPPPSPSWSQLSTIFHFRVGLNSFFCFFLLNASQGHLMFLCNDYWTL